MMKPLIKPLVAALALALSAGASLAQGITLQARMTLAPVVIGPSGYFAALANGDTPIALSLVRMGDGNHTLRDAASGRFVETGFTQYNYLNFGAASASDRSRFAVHRSGDTIQLRSLLTGLFVGFNAGSGRLRAAHEQDDPQTIFTVIPGDELNPVAPVTIEGRWGLQAARNRDGAWMQIGTLRWVDFGLQFGSGNAGHATYLSSCGVENFAYTVSGQALHFRGIDHGMHRCEGYAQAFDAEIRHALDGTVRVEIDAVGQLGLYDNRERLVLLFGRRN